MTSYIKKLGVGACILLILCATAIRADVKLRVYLKDGNLQAGNLVKETPGSFVLVTAEGRVEVPKNKIMFINGKTLRQWETDPNQNFETEIIPSEVPDPAYVNTRGRKRTPIKPYSSVQSTIPEGEQVRREKKMDLPEAPKLEPVKAGSEKPVEKKVEKVVAEPRPKPVQKKVTKKPAPKVKAKKKVLKQPVVKKKAEKKKAVVKKKAKAKPKKIVKAKPVKSYKRRKGRRFNREKLAAVHYQVALGHLEAGEKGRAIQELHYAQVLDRKSTDISLKLGELYMNEGVFPRANKYFKHPNLRKTDQVKEYKAKMESSAQNTEREPYVLSGVAFASVLFGTIPVIFVKRKISRWRERRSQTIVADDIAVSPLPMDVVLEEKPEPVAAAPAPPPPPPPPAPVVPKPPVVEEKKPEEPKVPEAPAPPPPIVPVLKPIQPTQGPPPLEVIKPEPPELVPPEPPAPVQQPEPVMDIPHPLVENHKDIIERSSMVSLSVDRGNQFCAEGRLDDARREYRTAMAIDPQFEPSYVGLGFLSYSQGQWELAMEYYVRALRLNANSADAHYGIGRILVDSDRLDEAVPHLQKALELDPGYEDARDTLAFLGKAA